jgi:copper homeostasis protein CutC
LVDVCLDSVQNLVGALKNGAERISHLMRYH